MNSDNLKSDNLKLEKGSSGNELKRLSKKKIFKETGKIIANPLIYKNYDYFNEN